MRGKLKRSVSECAIKKSFTPSSVWNRLRALQDVRSSVTVGSRLGFNVRRVAVRATRRHEIGPDI